MVEMKEDKDAAVQDGIPVLANPAPAESKPVEEPKATAEEEDGPNLLSLQEEQTLASIAASKSVAELAEQADSLFAKGEPEKAKALLLEEFTRGVDVADSGALYWRLVKAQYELFSNSDDAKLQQEYLERGIELATDVCPSILAEDKSETTEAMLLKWKAILLGKMGAFQSTKEKMSNSFLIKESLEEAQALLSVKGTPDSSIYQALGEWCFKVANISFIERQAASVLFGTPPKATYEEALEFFQKGYDLKATPALANKMAKTYQKLGQSTEAEEWSAKAQEKVAA